MQSWSPVKRLGAEELWVPVSVSLVSKACLIFRLCIAWWGVLAFECLKDKLGKTVFGENGDSWGSSCPL